MIFLGKTKPQFFPYKYVKFKMGLICIQFPFA